MSEPVDATSGTPPNDEAAGQTDATRRTTEPDDGSDTQADADTETETDTDTEEPT